MLCFSHDWTGDPLSKTHLMRLLAERNRILWVNSIGYRTPSLASKRDWGRIIAKLKAAAAPIREVEPNLFVTNPLVVPAWGRPSIRALNRRLLRWQIRRAMKSLGFREPMNWVFNPAAGILAGDLGEREVIYYCVDEYVAFSGVDAQALAEVERKLIRRADAVIVSAEALRRSKAGGREPVLVRHGVDHDHFRRALDPQVRIPEDLAGLRRPAIGYFGLMSEDWVDVPLLLKTARAFPDASLVLLGKVAMDLSELEREPNVSLLGRKPYADLPAYCKGFDVAIIPFPISQVTLSANPLKAREYLAAGLPVVSTAIPEVEALGDAVRIGRSHEDFIAGIRESLERPGPDPARSASMASESWRARLDEVRAAVAAAAGGAR
jgi:glycosyltransferase involved in cell wall biosynthesis